MRFLLRLAVFSCHTLLLSGCMARTGLGDDLEALFRCRQNCETPGPSRTLAAPKLSADGGLLALPMQYKLANDTRLRGKLLLYEVARQTWREIPLPDGVVATGIDFSPDGARAALSLLCRVSCAPGTHGEQIALVDMPFAETLSPRYLTHDENRMHGPPRFSPDGKRLAYAVTRVYWQRDGNFQSGFSNVAAMAADGSGEEQLLSTDEFLSVMPAGFSADGEIVFTAIAPQGATAVMLKARLAAAGNTANWLSLSAPYMLPPAGRSLPRLADSFGRLDTNFLSCATDCSLAVFIARRDLAERRYHYELFLAENGKVRPLTHFDQEGAPLIQAGLSADARQALVVNKDIPVRVEVATGKMAPVPPPDLPAYTGAP